VRLSDPDTHLLQQVVLPTDRTVGSLGLPDADEVLALYVDAPSGAGHVTGRRGYRVKRGERASFAAYANAFPAAYWQRWTDVEQVTLVAETDGAVTIELFASDASGQSRRLEVLTSTGGGAPVRATVPLTGFDDGGWLWFDLEARDGDVELRSAAWTTPAPAGDAEARSTVSLGITTYDRVGSCLALLAQVGDDPGLLDLVDTVYVVDQGEQRIRAADRFEEATAGLGERLTVLEQRNLGGSGGFARAQLETLREGRSRYLVLLDDDIVLEPESLRRAVAFADHCSQPMLVGAQMFSLAEPTRLYSMAESVELRRFQWGPTRIDQTRHDLAASGLRHTPWLHRRADVNYNGWWMCLVPREAMEKIGLSLPFFIRWDDAEFGLRAGEAGYPTVTLPGVSVWHMPWTHKTDALDWQAYFHQRNRIVAALLHSPHDHGGLLVTDLLAHQVKQLASMQYSTAELRLFAIADVLAGPESLHPALATKHVEARQLRGGYPDAEVRPDADAFPPAVARRRSRRTPHWATALVGVARQILPVSGESRRTPQVYLPAAEAHWSQLLKYDSAVVSTADGSGATWYRRDRAMFADITRRSLALHLRLYRAWPRLAAEYRGALAGLAAPETWQQTFQSHEEG
jgi:galactofuranosylgalactofuranosylrhamnosyl-N-acetylglucosaminyl-diphospho-decaprenol beta-1,5/1,6-galactofuranosyltransferase